MILIGASLWLKVSCSETRGDLIDWRTFLKTN
ncbi:MAG: hypothetical protein A4E60_00448 [Syntrophorhabdus sp. PtaB.Bin047]|nr:MAG: hypothetical protein A4E60_00448 [Syntrophorhabdus sp. PtaB.Bin047]